MPKKQNTLVLIGSAIIILAAILIGESFSKQYLSVKPGNNSLGSSSTGNQQAACAQDVETCPDGSTLARIGPNCEFPNCPVDNCDSYIKFCENGSTITGSGPNCDFADCPGIPNYINQRTSSWQAYQNSEYGFTINYPVDFSINNKICSSDGSCSFDIINSSEQESVGGMKQYVTICSISIETQDAAGLDYNSYITDQEASIISQQNITIPGTSGAKKMKVSQQLDPSLPNLNSYVIFIPEGQSTYIFNYVGDQESYLPLCDKIMSTLKFTK